MWTGDFLNSQFHHGKEVYTVMLVKAVLCTPVTGDFNSNRKFWLCSPLLPQNLCYVKVTDTFLNISSLFKFVPVTCTWSNSLEAWFYHYFHWRHTVKTLSNHVTLETEVFSEYRPPSFGVLFVVFCFGLVFCLFLTDRTD